MKIYPLNIPQVLIIEPEIIGLHDAYLLNMAWPNESEMKYQASDSLFKFIEANHFFNINLWNAEDLARRQNASDSEITKNKKQITDLISQGMTLWNR